MKAIPNFENLRLGKPGYDRRFSIDTDHPLYHDPLVDPRENDFGFVDASSYYSKPNRMTGEVLPGIPNAPLVRLDVVKRLVQAENFLQSDPDVKEALGAPAHLRIDDALRPYQVQKFAFEVAWPAIIKRNNPDITDDELVETIPKYCAKPDRNLTPTPHLTGGAVDVALVNLETGQAFDRGYIGGQINGTANPDYYEGYQRVNQQNTVEDIDQNDLDPQTKAIRLGRRVLYYAMTEVAGLSVNPQEIWHYGRGDPLSEYVSGTNHPYYGIAELPDWYLKEMTQSIK